MSRISHITKTVTAAALCVSLNIISCADTSQVQSSPRPAMPGWECSPALSENPDSGRDHAASCTTEKEEYYFFSVQASASAASIKSRNPEQIKSSCLKNAERTAAETFSKQDTGLCPSGILPSGEENAGARTTLNRHAGENQRMSSCCAFDEKTNACAAGADQVWSTCLCRGYVHYPGGLAAFKERYYLNNCY